MISCSQYDYIELICLYRYPVKLELKSGSVVTGSALESRFLRKIEKVFRPIAQVG
nr:Rho-binding antiterminator [Vibrio ishigakensis]